MATPIQNPQFQNPNARAALWDCGSSLYDSFELKSFEKQLHSAIHSRSLSMPHLPDRRLPPSVEAAVAEAAAAPLPPPVDRSKKPPSKISRSVNKFLKSVFKSRQNKDRPGGQYYVVYDKSGALSTIPEVPEINLSGGFSPEIGSLMRRSGSERFPAASMMGISCA